MKSALIGYTGFVGNNLMEQYNFTDLYNSKNFQQMKEQEYDLVVCAGISAVKWMANKAPDKDIADIKELEDILVTINANQFILISTIDVYPLTQGKDESFDCNSMQNHPYGAHRLAFEQFCMNHFKNCTVVRLPGLFGEGLKKNVIYDLLNDHCLEMINTKSSFQYYYLKYLWQDIQKAVEKNIKCINFFTEPVTTKDIYETFFSSKSIGQSAVSEGHYDLYTRYASIWNNCNNYIYTRDQIMLHLSEFIADYEHKQECQ